MKISFVELENYYPIKIAKWLENAFRWFESVYRPKKNEIVRCTMKSSLRSDEIFGVPPQMKLNPPPSPAVRQISSRSDFIHRRWISSAIGGFS